MANKNEEKQVGEFFLGRLNKAYGYDYIAKLNDEEGKKDPDIDLYAKSLSKKYPLLNLQIVTSDGEIKKEFGRLEKINKKTKQSIMGKDIDCSFNKWIFEEIKRKESMYSGEVKKSLVLLVKFDLSPLDEKYAFEVFGNFKASEFMGIYAVNLPTTMVAESSNNPHEGQILVIKHMFNDGRIKI